MNTVTFPGLGLEFVLDRVAFTVFGHAVYWYGVIIALGFLLAVAFCLRLAPKFGVDPDSLIDMLLFAVPASIVGARVYYVINDLGRSDAFRKADGSLDFAAMVRIWDGGIAIYGAVIAAVLTVFIFCRVRKVKFGAYVDVGAFGLLIGQAVGRWGNFVNVEVFGYETDLPWRMGVQVWDAAQGWVYQEVHPTFLYESLWNVVGLGLLLIIARRWRRFDGQMFLTYVLWYGLGRAWIEGVRQDYLPFLDLDLTLFGGAVRTSQVVAAVSAAAALGLLIYHLAWRKHSPEELYVNEVAAAKAQQEAETPAGAAGAETDGPAEAGLAEEKEDEDDDGTGREGAGGGHQG